MRLNNKSLEDKEVWNSQGFALPGFDRAKVAERTRNDPSWIHFGAGNIFRAFPAAVLQRLLDAGLYDRGVIVAEGYDYDIINKVYRPFDDLSLLIALKADSTIEKRIIGSITESLIADPAQSEDWERLQEIFASPSLQMVSFTITEKGYDALDDNGIIAKVVRLLYTRYQKGAVPIALVSMDNCVHNGDRLYKAVKTVADQWVKIGTVPIQFIDYLSDEGRVSFPWSMIDKITPRPSDVIGQILKASSYEDADIIITGKNTYISSYVNAEEAHYLVIEDAFPNGRPPLEKGGLLFTNRDTVSKAEAMKVCTCLNPLHTALAIFGCILGYKSIHSEMNDPDLKRMVEVLGYREGLPVVQDPGIINPADFLREVIEVRLPNPFMPDTPQRIATDTSQKLPIRFGQTIKAYLNKGMDIQGLIAIPLVFAAWCRYLMGIDDEGMEFSLSPDPLLSEVCRYVNDFKLGGQTMQVPERLHQLLANDAIFGVNLYDAGLGRQVEEYFCKMLHGKGAVRAVIHQLLC